MANKKLLILGNPQGSGPSSTVWGDITGNLADQTDLQNALSLKANSSDLATRKQDLDLSTLNQTEMADFYANYATYKTTYDLNWAGLPIVSINTWTHQQYGTLLVLEFGIYGQTSTMTGNDTTVGFIVKLVFADGTVQDFSSTMSFKPVCHTGSYNDLTDKPTIPTVNDATITIQQNGTTVGTFTTNDSTDTTINLTGGGSDVDENQVLLPLYFENISDTSKDITLNLAYSIYVGSRPNISLQKSLNNVDWEAIAIPTTEGGSTTISIPAKSRVYIKGVNSKFCNFQSTSSGNFYNHYYFDTISNNKEYIFVGGNLMSLLRGDDFTTYTSVSSYNLSAYSFCKLFVNNIYSNGEGNIRYFEKMIIGFPSGTYITPNSNSFSYMFDSRSSSSLNLSHNTIYFQNATDCCAGMNNVILNDRFNDYTYDSLTTNQYVKQYLKLGFANGTTGIASYTKLADKPNMSTETLTFIDANNVQTTVVVYVQPTV